MLAWWQRREHRWGIMLAAVALSVDLVLSRTIALGSVADPLPLFLALGHLTRGLTGGLRYWRVEPAMYHLAYLSALTLAAFLLLAWRKRRGDVGLGLVRTALVAITAPLAVQTVIRVDHLIVAFYYGLSMALSVGWTLFLSRQLDRMLGRIGYNPVNQ